MKLVKCEAHKTLHQIIDFIVICVNCDDETKISEAYADTEGKPFDCYYCEPCVIKQSKLIKKRG